jgi:hypothetical protein
MWNRNDTITMAFPAGKIPTLGNIIPEKKVLNSTPTKGKCQSNFICNIYF